MGIGSEKPKTESQKVLFSFMTVYSRVQISRIICCCKYICCRIYDEICSL